MNEELTKSEGLFIAACQRHGYVVNRLTTRAREGLKTPDFQVEAGHVNFVAEVKELLPNKEDLQIIQELRTRGVSSITGGGEIGSRVRVKIREAKKQLKHYRSTGIPLVLVLYDNIAKDKHRASYPDCYLEPYQIDAAMYGHLVASVSLTAQKSTMPDRAGGERTMTPTEKTYISAIIVISAWNDESLSVYHNRFAEVPLPFTVFTDPKSAHYVKSGEPGSEPWLWHKV
jgi:hypothetical protein